MKMLGGLMMLNGLLGLAILLGGGQISEFSQYSDQVWLTVMGALALLGVSR